jgi:cellular nucleic acid-binding protein
MPLIYVLELRSGKYYVGTTTDVDRRYEEHASGKGSIWTRQYKPLSILETRRANSIFDEENVTKEYMMKYGIENVRGGPFCGMSILPAQMIGIERSIWSATCGCLRCGRKTHRASECKEKDTVSGRKLEVKDRPRTPAADSKGVSCWYFVIMVYLLLMIVYTLAG